MRKIITTITALTLAMIFSSSSCDKQETPMGELGGTVWVSPSILNPNPFYDRVITFIDIYNCTYTEPGYGANKGTYTYKDGKVTFVGLTDNSGSYILKEGSINEDFTTMVLTALIHTTQENNYSTWTKK